MKLLAFTICFFLAGMLVNYLFKDEVVQSVWSYVYFLWDKTKDLLLWAVIYFFISHRQAKTAVMAIIVFCIARIIWEGLVIEKDYVFASHYRIIDILFVTLLIVMCSILVKPNETTNGKKRNARMGGKRNVGL